MRVMFASYTSPEPEPRPPFPWRAFAIGLAQTVATLAVGWTAFEGVWWLLTWQLTWLFPSWTEAQTSVTIAILVAGGALAAWLIVLALFDACEEEDLE